MEKRRTKCGMCKYFGHNRRTCPIRDAYLYASLFSLHSASLIRGFSSNPGFFSLWSLVCVYPYVYYTALVYFIYLFIKLVYFFIIPIQNKNVKSMNFMRWSSMRIEHGHRNLSLAIQIWPLHLLMTNIHMKLVRVKLAYKLLSAYDRSAHCRLHHNRSLM